MNELKEGFDAVLRLLEREDQLTNSRMTWYLTIQGFIIAGIALTYAKDTALGALQESAIILLSSLGIALSVVVFIVVRRARSAKKKLREQWHIRKIHKVDGSNWFPEPFGDTSVWSILTPGQSVPVILIAFWLMIIYKGGNSVTFLLVWIVVIFFLIAIWFVRRLLSKLSQKKNSSITGVVYYLDGTIIDSAPVHSAAWQAAGDKYGIEITHQFLSYQKGRTNEEAAKYLLDPLAKVEILKDFVNKKMDYANQHAGDSHYFHDFTLAYKSLGKRGIPVWICTTSPMQFCLKIYNKFPQLQDFAERTVWREMYQNGKAEGLRIAFENMGVLPKNGIYVGDSPSDLEAAREVGCLFVWYGNSNPTIKEHRELLSLLP
jgi:beta-phosphoglucomutase-like phosphatase (HAD superfamily)